MTPTHSSVSCHAFIWDLDGTLLDSYPAIVPGMQDTLARHGLHYEADFIRDFVVRFSVTAFMHRAAGTIGMDGAELMAEYFRNCGRWFDRIRPMPHVPEVLRTLRDAGCPSFVYTHRDDAVFGILEQTGLAPFFTEVLSCESGFPRKPDPAAILYFLEKYRLDPERTWYVGDRDIDMEAARNAGIRGILYLLPDSPVSPTGLEDHIVTDLSEIPSLLNI